MKTFFNSFLTITKTTFKGFDNHNLMTFAAGIAFYTIFSLPGLLITIIVTAGFFLGQEAVEGELISQLEGLIGTSSAASVQGIIKNIQLSGDFSLKTAFGIGTLLFSATTIFITLQEALNRIWDVVAVPERGFVKFIFNRVISFGMIISLGFILLVSLLLDTLLSLFFDRIEEVTGKETSFWIDFSSHFSTILIVFIVISLLFKLLPDVQLKWRDVIMASLITTGFLMVGNYGIGAYIKNSNFTETYDAAGSIIIILVWVYYSTVVVLLGAEITRAIMIYNRKPIRPAKGAKKISLQTMDYDEYKSNL
ncbi:YihY/virulence factor BrkB family protein [Crocinitomix algicola]|uniref:YihY/virulence factor BrkB family protein n=1 Tax=Crocinitomix algicola TaxID=1740263 RepID=UPI00082E129F|nr:YihY/virulence factor BrkB family protein [Crocinitomix algicola]